VTEDLGRRLVLLVTVAARQRSRLPHAPHTHASTHGTRTHTPTHKHGRRRARTDHRVIYAHARTRLRLYSQVRRGFLSLIGWREEREKKIPENVVRNYAPAICENICNNNNNNNNSRYDTRCTEYKRIFSVPVRLTSR